MDCFTPQQTIELVSRMGAKKAHMRLDKLFWNAFLAGPLLGFGCAAVISVNASPWYQENAPGLIRLIGALIFPIGLTMIVLSGADLWTANIMYMIVSLLSKRIRLQSLAISWVVSYLGNLAGSLFTVAIIFGYGGVFDESPVYAESAIRIAMQKCAYPQWHQIFLRAIGANWLVCFAVFSSLQARELASKVIALWWPTATFVALALDHTIANMFFIPMGIWSGAPLGVGTYIWKSMIATSLGNMVGGGFFVGAMYWYLYLTGETSVSISFNLGGPETAMEGAAGPLKIHGKELSASLNGIDPKSGNLDSGPENSDDESPPSAGEPAKSPFARDSYLASAIGRDLSDQSPWAMRWHERQKATRVAKVAEEKGDDKV